MTANDHTVFEEGAAAAAAYLTGQALYSRRADGGIDTWYIVETEAYPHNDTACYGYGYAGNFGDKPKTKANAPLFERGGCWCVYGGMLLLVCGKEGLPDNVLIRGIASETEYCRGPCRAASRLGVDKRLHGRSVWDGAGDVFLRGGGGPRRVCRTVRQGLGNSVSPADRAQPLRFRLL